MALTDDFACLAGEIRNTAADVNTEITTFPSGAVSLRVRSGGRVFDMDFLPSYGMFGVGELEADAGFNSGYPFGFPDFASARAKLLDMLAEARVAPAEAS